MNQQKLGMPEKMIKTSEIVQITSLKPHQQNYRNHPKDQLDHIASSIKEHGFYRNVVVSNDGTILAGHGVVEASRQIGLKEVAVIKLDIDPNSPAALKVLTGDNYLSHFAEDDDRMLTEILKEIAEDDDLFGTGFDEAMLATLLMVTRSRDEIADFDAAAEWVGMPEYDEVEPSPQLRISFETEEERIQFIEEHDVPVSRRNGRIWSCLWGQEGSDDLSALKFEADE